MGTPASGGMQPLAPSHAAQLVGTLTPPSRPTGTLPAGLGEQVPRVPGSTQLSQMPLHAVLQHTPSTQTPAAQSSVRPQGCPRPTLGTQRPA
jgi:hypothetical protein